MKIDLIDKLAHTLARIGQAESSVRKRIVVSLLLVLAQGLGVGILVADFVTEMYHDGLTWHTFLEALATLALMVGLFFGAYELRRSYKHVLRSDAALKMAAGGFSDLVRERFDAWNLTPSEAEVALLTLKGFDAGEISKMRGTAAGTVRAQLGRVYSKSGTDGRGRFVSLFIDALLDETAAAESPVVAPAVTSA